MFKKIFQRTAVILMLSVGLLAAAETFGFSGGVTGHLWFGKVWARWNSHPKLTIMLLYTLVGKQLVSLMPLTAQALIQKLIVYHLAIGRIGIIINYATFVC